MSTRSTWTLLERLEQNVCWKMSEASSTIAASGRSFLGRSMGRPSPARVG